jgi:hypothetical protein
MNASVAATALVLVVASCARAATTEAANPTPEPPAQPAAAAIDAPCDMRGGEAVVAFPPEVCRFFGEPNLCALRADRPKPSAEPPDRVLDLAVFTKDFARELKRCGLRVASKARTILVPSYERASVTTKGTSGRVEWRAHLDVVSDGERKGRCAVSRTTLVSQSEGADAMRERLDADRDALARDLARAANQPCAMSRVGR